MPFIEKCEESRDIYNLVQIVNNCQDDNYRDVALATLEKVLFAFDSANDFAENYFPHLLTEDLTGEKPAKWTWKEEEYHCLSFSDFFRQLTDVLYKKYPDQLQNFCAYGGDNYICSAPRKRMTRGWDKIGANCYIYTAVSFSVIQKSILNMLRFMRIDLNEIHMYLRQKQDINL